jgi:pyroglutamyl-peptidase
LVNSRILLTSFETWLPHQPANSSDDLLADWQGRSREQLFFSRRLPVDIPQASERVIKAIESHDFDIVLCCGMAESRYCLTLESNARSSLDRLYTPICLETLVATLPHTALSHDAGQFVCEGLYYQVLKHHPKALFLHVPRLTDNNYLAIRQDFQAILQALGQVGSFLTSNEKSAL